MFTKEDSAFAEDQRFTAESQLLLDSHLQCQHRVECAQLMLLSMWLIFLFVFLLVFFSFILASSVNIFLFLAHFLCLFVNIFLFVLCPISSFNHCTKDDNHQSNVNSRDSELCEALKFCLSGLCREREHYCQGSRGSQGKFLLWALWQTVL